MAAERETATDVAPDYDFDFGDLSSYTEDVPEATTPVEATPPVEETPTEEAKPSILDFIKNDEEDTPPADDKVKPEVKVEQPATPPVTQTTEEEETPDDTTTTYGENDDETAVGIFEVMKEKGYVTEDMDFKGDFESLDAIFEDLPDAIFQSVFKQFPKPMQNLLRFAYAKGEKVEWSDISNYIEEFTPFDASRVKIESAEEQRDFLKKQMIAQGNDADDAEILLDKWEDDGKLKAKSEALLTKLKESSTTKADGKVQETEQEKQARKVEKRKFVNNIRQTVADTGFSRKRQQEVLTGIFRGDINTISKKIHQHPKAFVKLANYLSYFDEKTGDINEEDFKKQAFSATTRQVQTSLQKHFGKKAKATKVKPKTQDTGLEFEFVT